MEGERGRPFVRAVRGRLRGAGPGALSPFPIPAFPHPCLLPAPSAALGCEQDYAIFYLFFLKGISLFCGLICLYFKLPNPCDHLEELFLVSLILDVIGVTEALSPSRDRRCPPGFAAFFPLWD